jgi:hypothetical protein
MADHTPDLTQRPPRSPRVRLGGLVLLPRMIDKGRATVAGKNGEYIFNCPLDQQLTQFAGLEAEALKAELAAGKGDGEILEWVFAHAAKKLDPLQIQLWSAFQEQRAPADVETRQFFHGLHEKVAPQRKDIVTWFDLLDLDDYASFGGKA